MAKRESFAGRVVAITGAGSGIGRALAERFADEGADLSLCDVDEAGLGETVQRVEAKGRRVHAERVDVAQREAVHAWADATRAVFDGRVDAIVNNAGVALGGTFQQLSYEDLEWLLGINLWGVIHGTRAFLPTLVERGDGWVVNLSSVFGLVGVYGQSAYNTSKFAVRGLTEALWQELEGTGVTAVSVHPGGIKTAIAKNARVGAKADLGMTREEAGARFDKVALTTADGAAKTIVEGMRRRQRRVLVGPDAYVFEGLSRSLPRTYSSVLMRLFGDEVRLPDKR